MDLTPDQYNCLKLIRTGHIGPVTYARLIQRCGSAENALKELPALYAGKKTQPQIPTNKQLDKELAALNKMGAQLLFMDVAAYPDLLRHIADAPPVISVLGDINLLGLPQIAIVGNRNASATGFSFSEKLAGELAAAGFAITSGLARGIDTAAHQGALQANGKTVAVIAGGLDHIYPAENKALFERIGQEGCIVAEMPLGVRPEARHFPRRNRIISGLTHATIVTEASRHSGSLITAQFAGEQGREVFAVPGNPADPRAAGPNHLIKQGVAMLTEADDLLQSIKPWQSPAPKPVIQYTREAAFNGDLFTDNTNETNTIPLVENESSDNPILNLLSATPVSMDHLIRQSGLSEADVIITLTELELAGQACRTPDGQFTLA